jgi:hypothetical protein
LLIGTTVRPDKKGQLGRVSRRDFSHREPKARSKRLESTASLPSAVLPINDRAIRGIA